MKKKIINYSMWTALFCISAFNVWSLKKKLSAENKRLKKFTDYFNMMDQWMSLKENGRSLERYFIEHDIHKIAIYGFGKMGKHLYEELKKSKVEIEYFIDRMGSSSRSEIDVLTLNDRLPYVDMIVVSATFDYEAIVDNLCTIVDYPVISLEDVILECFV